MTSGFQAHQFPVGTRRFSSSKQFSTTLICVAASGAATENRELVPDELAAAVGEDGRAAGETCPVLLAGAGGEPSDSAAVRGHGAADRVAVATGGLESSG